MAKRELRSATRPLINSSPMQIIAPRMGLMPPGRAWPPARRLLKIQFFKLSRAMFFVNRREGLTAAARVAKFKLPHLARRMHALV
ncbi:hypothetical protein FAK_10960 [Desulfoferula mesophila]|uniref:Uncharacterized protein n=1 Tax=Desulfoferula mesophila TaxID=3058419 RepID=A0AAU9EDL5_9BACT|nr:hypothetical protein FAK_10960 [Desulfoferula mesophilus]